MASKIFSFYSNLAEFASSQQHYDWSLRSVKIVLLAAGELLRREPELDEQVVVMTTLRDMNESKIVVADQNIFITMIASLFPGVTLPESLHDVELEGQIKGAIIQRKLWPEPDFIRRVHQLHDSLRHRHSVFILGDAGSGKSECWKILARAQGLQYANVVDINPKVSSTDQFYGHIVPSTREWKDGVFSSTLRTLALRDDNHPKWIILDGDLDAHWVESMNSLMDDNKLLTLANNDRIYMPACMRVILETADIQHASPATVSRAAVLWVPTKKDGRNWKNVVAAWVQNQERSDWVKEALHRMCDDYIPTILEWLCGGGTPKGSDALAHATQPGVTHPALTLVAQTTVGLVQSFLKTVGGMMNETNCRGSTSEEVVVSLRNTFAFAALWSFGGCLAGCGGGGDGGGGGGGGSGGADKESSSGKDRCRSRFDAWFRHRFTDIPFPARDTVHDYWLDPTSDSFENWKASPGFYSVDFDSSAQSMHDVIVPTPETCALRFWVARALAVNRHCLLVGKSGVGKSQVFKVSG